MSLQEKEYISRINKVFDYIENNIERAFSLEELADIANFSKYHFHRIFYSIVGETPFQFILRVRLEKAASLLILNRNISITDIATKCGFSDISIFSRSFKNYFHLSASQYRISKQENSNLSQKDSNKCKLDNKSEMYFCPKLKTLKWRTNMKLNKKIEVKELPTMTVAYIRHIGPYKGNAQLFDTLWGKLCGWAGPKGLLKQNDLQFLSLYHDDPNITSQDKLRLSVCITVPASTKVDGEIGKMTIEGGKYVISRFELNDKQFEEAWGWVYSEWLPNSGYVPDDKPAFELYPEEPKDGRFVVDICVPIKPI